MRRPLIALGAAAALWLAMACLDIASPITGISSITSVLLPTPSVVVNDSSRDTSGNAARLQVYAFGPNGDRVNDITVRYVVIDTSGMLTVDSLGYAHGGTAPSPLAQVVAQVTPSSGKGVIQTLLVSLPVVPVPMSAVKGGDTSFVFDPTAIDSLNSGLLSPPLNVTLYGSSTDSTIQKYVVSYEIVRTPQSADGAPTVVLFDPTGNDSTVAVTSSSGVASRQLRVRLHSIQTSLRLGTEDTVVVRVHVRYQKTGILITPADSFVVPIRASAK